MSDINPTPSPVEPSNNPLINVAANLAVFVAPIVVGALLVRKVRRGKSNTTTTES